MIHIGVRSFVCFSGQIEVKSVVEKGCIQNQLFWFNRFHIFEDSKGFSSLSQMCHRTPFVWSSKYLASIRPFTTKVPLL